MNSSLLCAQKFGLVILSAFQMVFLLGACQDKVEPAAVEMTDFEIPSSQEFPENGWIVPRTFTNESTYRPGDIVELRAFQISNMSREDLRIDSVWLEVGTAQSNGKSVVGRLSLEIPSNVLESGGEIESDEGTIKFATHGLRNGSYLVMLKAHVHTVDSLNAQNHETSDYLTFFHVTDGTDPLTYNIEQENYNGLPVYKLNGGLSAEYAVQKSAATITSGISHSWVNISPPISSTPDFLRRSIDRTIAFYDSVFGRYCKFETVFISTGITPVSYVAAAMNAPILPLHFLVGSSTIKEVQTILDFAARNDAPAYATYGHDYSLSESKGVAWIKLLDLPEAYLEFLINHQVQELLFFGATSSGGGEKTARQLLNGINHGEPGSIYLMYFAGSQAEDYLHRVIKDFDFANQGPLIQIADWESGITERQVEYMTKSAKEKAAVTSTHLLTSELDDIHLWNLATYAMLKFFKVNEIMPRGVSLNPYLTGHPSYEKFFGYIPFLYLNSTALPVSWHFDRVTGMLSDAVRTYFPEVSLEGLPFVANTGINTSFFEAMLDAGFEVSILANEDIWNLSDGIESPSEARADELMRITTYQELVAWANELTLLSLEDIEELSRDFQGLSLTDY